MRASTAWKVLATVLGALLMAVPSVLAFHNKGESVTPAGDILRPMFHQVVWVSLAIFLIVEVLLLYFLIKYRKRKGSPEKGPEVHGNTKLEIAWTIGPALIMIWLLVISFNGLQAIDYGPTDGSEPEVYIDVITSQFAFTYVYPDGSRATDNTVRFQEDTWVQFNVTSTDVIHAFSSIDLDFIVDANPCEGDPIKDSVRIACPGEMNHVWVNAREPGMYLVQCRQYCGIGHGAMISHIEVFEAGSQERPWGPAEVADEDEAPAQGNETGNETGGIPEDFEGEVVEVSLVEWALQDTWAYEPGTEIAFVVTNEGTTVHNMYLGQFTSNTDFEAFAQTVDLQPGESETIIVTVPEEDQVFDYWCNIGGHVDLGMIGQGTIGDAELGEGPTGPEPLLPGPSPLLLIGALVGIVAWIGRKRA